MKCINTAHFDDGEEVIANVFINAGKDVEKLYHGKSLIHDLYIWEILLDSITYGYYRECGYTYCNERKCRMQKFHVVVRTSVYFPRHEVEYFFFF